MPSKRQKVGKKKLRVAPSGQTRRKVPMRRMKTTTGESKRSRIGGPSSGRPMTVTAPSSVGFVIPQATFAFSGRAQQVADQDAGSSVRVTGTDLYGWSIKSGSGTFIEADPRSRAVDPNVAAIAAGFSSVADGSYNAPLSPLNVSPRLKAVAGCFLYYVFREVQIIFVPQVGSTTATSLALGYMADRNKYDDPASPVQQQVIEMTPSLITPVWQASSMTMRNSGTKLYNVYNIREDLDTIDQGLFVATLLGAAASTVYGQLWLKYTVDLYQPCAFTTNVARAVSMVRLHSPELLKDLREEKKKVAPATGEPVRVDCDDDFVTPSPPSYRPAPSGPTIPGSPAYQPVKIPSRK